jgi:hypothetical protein
MGLARILAEKSDPSSVNMALGVPYFPELTTIVIGGYYPYLVGSGVPYGTAPTPPTHQTPTTTPSGTTTPLLQSVFKTVFGGGGK